MSDTFKKDIFTEEELWEKSILSDTSILEDKNITLIKDNYGTTPLHKLANFGIIEVLNHPKVAKIKNIFGNTPLHYLALAEKIDILKHPEMAIVKNNEKSTPLHYLAKTGASEILDYPEILSVKNRFEELPIHLYYYRRGMTLDELLKVFPWYDNSTGIITKELLDKLINTPQSVRFILS